jgi:hypothetical protein
VNNWELAFLILGIVFAITAAAAIVLLVIFGARRDGQRNAEVQAELERRGVDSTEPLPRD